MSTSSVRAIQSNIHAVLSLRAKDLRGKSPRSLVQLTDDCQRFYRYNEMPYEVNMASSGIRYALATGRLYGQLHMAVEKMTGSEATALIAAIAHSCKTEGEVPRWLIANADVIIH